MNKPLPLDAFAAETAAIVAPFKSSFNATWLHEITNSKPTRDWLIKNLILAKSFGIVYGPPGCGKSFLCSDMALTAVAAVLDGSRPEWFGYKARPFGVVYLVAEGREDFEIRLHAWREANNIPADAILPFVFLPTSIDMRSSDVDTKRLAAEIKALSSLMMARCGVSVGMVIVDTVARALNGGNENASEVMGAFVINCEKLKEETGAAVLGVHHGGKEAGRGPRGHEALHGAADFEIEVTGATEATPNLWTVRKLKAAQGGATHRFRLRQTTLGQDEDGDAVTSCVVVSYADTKQAAAPEKPKGFKVNDNEREFLTALAEAIDKSGVMPPPDLQVPQKVVLVAPTAEVRRIFIDKYTATESGTAEEVEQRLRARWSRAVKKMLRFKVVEAKDPWTWFTGKEVMGFRVRGISAPDTGSSYVEPEVPLSDDDIAAFVDEQTRSG